MPKNPIEQWNQVGQAHLAFPHNKGGRTNTAFSKQCSALFGRCERSEHKRPVRTVTVVAVVLTATESGKGRMRVVHSLPCHFERSETKPRNLAAQAAFTPTSFLSTTKKYVGVHSSPLFTTFLPLPAAKISPFRSASVRHYVPSVRRNDKVKNMPRTSSLTLKNDGTKMLFYIFTTTFA
jgi:hypothetical protein